MYLLKKLVSLRPGDKHLPEGRVIQLGINVTEAGIEFKANGVLRLKVLLRDTVGHIDKHIK